MVETSSVTSGLFAGALMAAGIDKVELAPTVENNIPERHRNLILVHMKSHSDTVSINATRRYDELTMVSGPSSSVAGYRGWRSGREWLLEQYALGHKDELAPALDTAMQVKPALFKELAGVDLDIAVEAMSTETWTAYAELSVKEIQKAKYRANKVSLLPARVMGGYCSPGAAKSYVLKDYKCPKCDFCLPKVSTLYVEAQKNSAKGNQFFCGPCFRSTGVQNFLEPVKGSTSMFEDAVEEAYPKMEAAIEQFRTLADAKGVLADSSVLLKDSLDYIPRQFAIIAAGQAPGVFVPKTSLEDYAVEAYGKLGYEVRPYHMVRRWSGLHTVHLKWLCHKSGLAWVPKVLLFPICRHKEDAPDHKKGSLVFSEDQSIDPGYHSQLLVPKPGNRRRRSGTTRKMSGAPELELEDISAE